MEEEKEAVIIELSDEERFHELVQKENISVQIGSTYAIHGNENGRNTIYPCKGFASIINLYTDLIEELDQITNFWIELPKKENIFKKVQSTIENVQVRIKPLIRKN